MEPHPPSNTPPPIENALLEPTDANLKKIRKSRWSNLLYFILILTFPALDMCRSNRQFNTDQKFTETLRAVKLGDAYRDDLFYTSPILLTASSGSFDKVAVYFDRELLAILGLKDNKIVSCYMAAYIRDQPSLRVDDTIFADGYFLPYDPAKLSELNPESRGRCLELFLFVFNNDAAVKANLNASSQKAYAILRGEMYVFLLNQLKTNPGIQINKYRDF